MSSAILLLALPLLSHAHEAARPQGIDPAARLLSAGRSALAAGDLARATADLKEALGLAPGEPEIRVLLARTRNDLGEHAEALRILAAGDATLASAWRETERGRACLAIGRADDAERAFRGALDSYPGCGPARLALARLLLAGDRLEPCTAQVTTLEAAAPDEPAVILVRARLLERQGAVEEAAQHVEAALARDIEAVPLRLALARLWIASGRMDAAWGAAAPVLDMSVDADILLQVSRVAQRADRQIDALAILGSILMTEPAHPAALRDMLELVEGGHGLVARLARRRMQSTPDDPYAWGELLEEHLSAGRCQAVMDALLDAPASVLDDPEVRLHEAAALRRLGRMDAARAKLVPLCSEQGPPEAWYELGLLEYASRRFTDAEAAFTLAARGDLVADAQYVRALCLEQLGQSAAAARALEDAVAARPDFIEAWLRLGNEYRLRLADTDRARRAYRRYLDLGGDDPQIRRWVDEVRR